MLKVKYYRKENDVEDLRFFESFEELNQWFSAMIELGDVYYIKEIEEII